MKKKSVLILSVLFFFFSWNAFSQINFLSPIEGSWSNKQMLVLEQASEGYYVYSVDGTDPEKFGFAYDGPVLLDVTGDVVLTVTHICTDGKRETKTINYSVEPFAATYSEHADFISSFFDSGILNYSAGTEIKIPDNLFYTLGLPPDAYISGRTISISPKSVLARYVPCTIWDKANSKKWRFVIKTFPQTAGVYSKKDVPFQVENWNKIIFTDRNKLYKIDDGYWSLPDEDLMLDRSVYHTISWQDLSYEMGNPVETIELPPKPNLIKDVFDDGTVIFSLDGDPSYKMSVRSYEEKDYEELFDEIGADVFFGDRTSGSIRIGVFVNSVLQGEFADTYSIDKRPPAIPQITTTASSFYSRSKVNVLVQAEENCELFIALSEPYFIKDFSSDYNPEAFSDIPAGNFKKAKNNSFRLTWQPKSEVCVYYKIKAYCKNGKNVSDVGEYSVIIDQYNYFIDESASADYEDGTAAHPFTSFEKTLELMNKSRSVALRIKGSVNIRGSKALLCNCEIINNGEGILRFAPESSLVLKGSSLVIKHCRLESNEETKSSMSQPPMIKLENSVLTLNDCQVSANFQKNGTFLDAVSSIINVSDCMISVNASSYSSFLSGFKSRIKISESVVNTSADTSVVFSTTGGNLSSLNCSFRVTGKNGRIAELFGTKASFENNKFFANLTNSVPNLTPVYSDSKTQFKGVNNEQFGF